MQSLIVWSDWLNSCLSGAAITQFSVVSPVILGGRQQPQLTTHNVDQSQRCSHQLVMEDDEASWRRVRTVHIAAKTDLKFDANQTRNFNLVLRRIVAGNVIRRTVCSYSVRCRLVLMFIVSSIVVALMYSLTDCILCLFFMFFLCLHIARGLSPIILYCALLTTIGGQPRWA